MKIVLRTGSIKASDINATLARLLLLLVGFLGAWRAHVRLPGFGAGSWLPPPETIHKTARKLTTTIFTSFAARLHWERAGGGGSERESLLPSITASFSACDLDRKKRKSLS
uniref:Uncharacterized protein n=1 Tax=Anopheles coluzzii TaxID=1518534 RepID=A0A8W7PH70_ANOCL